jgi:flagellum-specific ATP synthase
VLVEGDDFNEPISDIVRATLDGHIMLSRDLAHEGHFPAIDVLQSTSRLASELVGAADLALMSSTVELMASYERNRQMVDMGAYKAGSNADIDRAMQLFPAVRAVLRQSVLESSTRQDAIARLRKALGGAR